MKTVESKQSFLAAKASIIIDTFFFRRTVMNAGSTLVNILTITIIRSFKPFFTVRFTCEVPYKVYTLQIFVTVMDAKATLIDIKTVPSNFVQPL